VGKLLAEAPAFQLAGFDRLNDRAEGLPLGECGRKPAEFIVELGQAVLKLATALIPISVWAVLARHTGHRAATGHRA
jgi:hypothetical protein